MAAYEVRHPIPAHEHVYEARTAVEWRIVYTPTNQVEYPVLLEMLLSPHVEAPPTDVSVMGHFLLLHGLSPQFLMLISGLHVQIWTSQQIKPALDSSSEVGATIEDQRHHAMTLALNKWRDSWIWSKLRTPPAQAVGLYEERSFPYWALAKFLHEKKGMVLDGFIGKWSDSERVVNIMRIIKAVQMTLEHNTGMEEHLSTEIGRQVASPGNVRVSEDGEGLDSMSISFIMSRKPHTREDLGISGAYG